MVRTMLVDVYKNLHKDTWSIRDRKTGRVIDHSDVVHIDNATFVVQPAGRRKVLQERRKNVHAFIRGIWIQSPYSVWQEFENPTQVVYNPYESDQFRFKESGKPVTEAKTVILNQEGAWIDERIANGN